MSYVRFHHRPGSIGENEIKDSRSPRKTFFVHFGPLLTTCSVPMLILQSQGFFIFFKYFFKLYFSIT